MDKATTVQYLEYFTSFCTSCEVVQLDVCGSLPGSSAPVLLPIQAKPVGNETVRLPTVQQTLISKKTIDTFETDSQAMLNPLLQFTDFITRMCKRRDGLEE
jgi:hypothetical protein